MTLRLVTLTVASLLCFGCTDKEKEAQENALIKKYEAQKEILSDLEHTVGRLTEKVAEKQLEDPSEEIKKLKGQVEEAETQRKTLKSEIAELKAKKKAAEEKLADYKRKYPIR